MGWRKKFDKSRTVIPFPTGFTWTDAPIAIYKNGTGKYETDFDVSTFAPIGKRYYVDVVNGNDTNGGLTSGTALKKLRTALNKTDVVEVYLAGGVYTRPEGTFGDINKTVSIKAYNGTPILSMHENATWTLEAGNTYKTVKASVGNVYDAKYKDSYGDYQQLNLKASIAEVNANPGSYYIDSSTNTVYICLSDSRVPDSNVRVFLLYNNKVIGNITPYFEGIHFEGGGHPFWVQNSDAVNVPTIYAKNCKFKYSAGGNNAVRIEGANAYFQNCEAARGADDGFNYHIRNTVNCKVIEVNCVGRHNGESGDIDNGSTIHDGGKIIRVNGVYFGNKGPNVADVNDNTESWNVGCFAFDSKAIVSSQSVDFIHDSASKMWLEGCVSFESAYSLKNNTATSQSFVKNNRFEGQEVITGTKSVY